MWPSRSVLVTGGSGFVGYWLASYLAKLGTKTFVLDIKPLPEFTVLERDYRERITYIRGDVASQKLVQKILSERKIETVFHLAAEAVVSRAHENPRTTFESNVEGTWNLLECAREVGRVKEIVVASSDKAYGSHTKLPYEEHFALEGMNSYDASKSCTDIIARMYAKAYGLPIVVARFGNIYGAGDLNKTRLIPDALRCIYGKKELILRSDGTFLRDYVYIADVVDGYLRLAEEIHRKRIAGEAFNLAHNKPLSVMGVLAKLEKAADMKLKVKIRNTARHEIRNQYLNSRKAAKIIGWRAQTPMSVGFRETARWYETFFKNNGQLEA